MKRFLFSFLILVSAIARAEPPNIVLIISDDQSWNDYSFMGHEIIETPRLDQFAKESLTYTRGYVTSPLCRPSLASIFTGLDTPVHGITGNDISLDPEDRKSGKVRAMRSRVSPKYAPRHEHLYSEFRKHANLARLLKDSGYLTLQTGKFWEGDPKLMGFTHAMTHGDPRKGGRHGDEGLKISREGIAPIKSLMDESKKGGKPFFIWHAPFLPHTPHNPPKELYDKYLKLESNKFIARYYAMVEWFDQTCGELFDEVESRGLTGNTVFLYVTDNGWIQSPDSGRYAPLSKQDPHDGGIRTPIMVKWKGKIEPKMDKKTLVSAIDLAPTILKMCEVKVPAAMKGIDLRDGEALNKRDMIFGFDGAHDIADWKKTTTNLETRYVVKGDWKLLDNVGKPNELYNVSIDPWEKKNLLKEKPEKVKELSADLDAWWKAE
ncbi:MAG: sulfatase-like hydrolase/transferase [Akkermansiaceae bacterium]